MLVKININGYNLHVEFERIIEKIKNKTPLLKEEIAFVIINSVNGKLDDEKISQFLLAIYQNGFSKSNTITLTQEMAKSGKCLDLSEIGDICVDKHSTGGISDSTTLIIAPILACAKVPFAKMSGRALGFTGGTADKIETFKGYNAELTFEQFIENVKKNGACIITQSNEIAPADKIFYALRNKIGAVESLPLIASSIMSKKIATGAKILLLDVKVGDGAFMKNLHNAKRLAKLMVEIGKRSNISTTAFLTNMNSPLGDGIGCFFEIENVLEVLNRKTNNLSKLSFEIAKTLMVLSKKYDDKSAEKFIKKIIKNKDALKKFKQLIEANGGEFNIENPYNFMEIKAQKSGYVQKIYGKMLGEIVCEIGGGRKNKNDKINHNVGIKILKNVGDFVYENETLCKVYSKDSLTNDLMEKITNAFEIKNKKVKQMPLIYGEVK